jgi:hypothetical protein
LDASSKTKRFCPRLQATGSGLKENRQEMWQYVVRTQGSDLGFGVTARSYRAPDSPMGSRGAQQGWVDKLLPVDMLGDARAHSGQHTHRNTYMNTCIHSHATGTLGVLWSTNGFKKLNGCTILGFFNFLRRHN